MTNIQMDNLWQIDEDLLAKRTQSALHSYDDGESFVEHVESETFVMENCLLKKSSYSSNGGFSMRGIQGEECRFFHSSKVDDEHLLQAHNSLANKSYAEDGLLFSPKFATHPTLYSCDSPVTSPSREEKISLLRKASEYISKNDLVKDCTVSLVSRWQVVYIVGKDRDIVTDFRPLTRLNIQVILQKGDIKEQGYSGMGGRFSARHFIEQDT